MEKKVSANKFLTSMVSFLLVVTILFSSAMPFFAYSDDSVFLGINDIKIEENSQFNLLEGVSATDTNGNELVVKINDVTSNSDETYNGETVINIGPSGTVYQVEYIASSLKSENIYSAKRKVVSVSSIDSNKDEESLKNDIENVSGLLPNNSSAEKGLNIVFKNGFHYIEDPGFPDDGIILYCMNNKLAWPHETEQHHNVPNYIEGYLTPDDFESVEQYNEFIKKLRKLLFAGFPYNGERLFKIVQESEIHIPTEQEFNGMLIVPPQLVNDFPYLGHHEFTLDALYNEKHFDELITFIGEVFRLFPNGKTASGLTYADITSMPFYKVANSITFNGFNQPKESALETFAQLYSQSYFVTKTQAYDATQFAVWKLMHEYNIESNDIQSLENNELSKVLWQYCQHGALLDREPKDEEISLEGDLTFTYRPKDGMWHSGKLKIVEPIEYNGLYHLNLPEGVTAICEGLTYVYGNEEYELVSATKPKENSQFSITAEIDWLQDMKQYSPINSKEFQHMVGAIIKKTRITHEFFYDSMHEGSIEVSKTVVGNQQDLQDEFNFTLELLDHKLSGLYGEMEFNNGVAEFTLKHGETIRADHLPENARYKVIEHNNDNYFVESSNAEGNIIKEQIVKVEFKNTKLNDLLVNKIVNGEMGDKTKEFTFSIYVQKEDGTPLEGTYNYYGSVKSGFENESESPPNGTVTFVDGKAEVVLSHGQQIKIDNLPFMCSYNVTENEANQDGYITTYNGNNSSASGVLESQAEVSVVNTKEYIPETGINDKENIATKVGIGVAVTGILLIMLSGFLRRKRD